MTSDEGGSIARAAAFAAAGLAPEPSAQTEATLARAVAEDPDPRARAAALAAIARVGSPGPAGAAWRHALHDDDPAVRRRAAEVAPDFATRSEPPPLITPLVRLLDDADVTVVDAAAWALGEIGAPAVTGDAVPALAAIATAHPDALAREAAVAALGALGDEAGLPAILAGCRDKPTIRRRAVLALAPFEGEAVEAAIAAALVDRDWQVRQAAEDLTRDTT